MYLQFPLPPMSLLLLSYLFLGPPYCFLPFPPFYTLEMAPTNLKHVSDAKSGQKKTRKIPARMASHISGSHTSESELIPPPPEMDVEMETSNGKVECSFVNTVDNDVNVELVLWKTLCSYLAQ